MNNKKLVSFRLPDDLIQDLRYQADQDGISVTKLVCRMLRQGLHHPSGEHSEDEAIATSLVDQRIASLEEALHELKSSKQPAPLVTPTALHALLTQSLINHESLEIKSRLTELEKMHRSYLESNLDMKHHLAQIEQMVERLVPQAKE